MEDELHNRSVFLFWLLFGSNALDLKKTRWLLQRRIFGRRSQLEDIDFPILRCLIAKIASSLKKVIQNSNFKKGSIWKSRRVNLMTDSFAEDRSLCNECFPVTDDRFSISLKAMTFNKLIPDGMKSHYQFAKYPQTIFWHACIRCASVGLIN